MKSLCAATLFSFLSGTAADRVTAWMIGERQASDRVTVRVIGEQLTPDRGIVWTFGKLLTSAAELENC